MIERYRFTRSEVCVMWSHVEAEVALALERLGDDRVSVEVTVIHHGDPWGGHPEWERARRFTLTGRIGDGPTPGTLRITPDDPSIAPALTFDPAIPVADHWYAGLDEHRGGVQPDFWDAIVAWAARLEA